MDTDDFYNKDYLSTSIFNLIKSGKLVSGSSDMLLLDVATKTTYRQRCIYLHLLNEATMVYKKSFIKNNKFRYFQSKLFVICFKYYILYSQYFHVRYYFLLCYFEYFYIFLKLYFGLIQQHFGCNRMMKMKLTPSQ